MMHTCLAENTTNLLRRSCQIVIETLNPGLSQTWSMANLVMYCGIKVEAREALGSTYVYTRTYTTVGNTGYTTTHAQYAP